MLKCVFAVSAGAAAAAAYQQKTNKDDAISASLLSATTIHDKINALATRWSNDKVSCHINTFAANAPSEDQVAVRDLSKLPDRPGVLLGMFDGHTGGAASLFCKRELFHFLQVSFANREDKSLFLHEDPFLQADQSFLDVCLKSDRPLDGVSGSCYLVSFLDFAEKRVETAWGGDCRGVIGRYNAATQSWEAIELSKDHDLATHQGERERLQHAHPAESDVTYRNRVKGRLQPTRGIGDGAYKMMEFFQLIPQVHARYGLTGWNPPYTTALPEMSLYTLTPEDKFLVLGTDGLFQDLTSQEVVDHLGRFVDGQDTGLGKYENASAYLTEKVLERAGSRVLRRYFPNAEESSAQAKLSLVLQLPQGSKRRVHDDTTVLVAFFK